MIVEFLKEFRFAAIMGLPGIGKTMTARYVVKRFSEDSKKPIKILWIVPDEGVGPGEIRVDFTIFIT